MIDGLGQVIVAAGLQTPDDVARIGLGSDQDDRDERQRGIGFEAFDGLDAVELWHHHVEQHEVGHQLADFLQRLEPIGCGHHLVALGFEPHLQDVDIVRDIVDNQN